LLRPRPRQHIGKRDDVVFFAVNDDRIGRDGLDGKAFYRRPDTIVIHGEEDDVVALADVLAWARPQQLPVIVFPGCGHFFHGRLPQLQRVITGMWQK
jgi:pimeloyl-ACP methyl ester carboxylesterase